MTMQMRMVISAKKIARMVENGEINFDIAYQRGYVWSAQAQCDLIDSMLKGYYINVTFAVKANTILGESIGKYAMFDGKQRFTTIKRFRNDEFALDDRFEEYVLDDKIYDLKGKKYSELPEELQERFDEFPVDIFYYEGIEDEDLQQMFWRLNNGKSLNSITRSRCNSSCTPIIHEIGKHPVFEEMFEKKQLENFYNEDIAFKIAVLLTQETPSLESKDMRTYMENMTIDDDLRERLVQILDFMQKVHEDLDRTKCKSAKKLYSRNNFISVAQIADRFLDLQTQNETVTFRDFCAYIDNFFICEKGRQSKSDEYNRVSTSGANQKNSVKIRKDELTKYFEEYFEDALNPSSDEDDDLAEAI